MCRSLIARVFISTAVVFAAVAAPAQQSRDLVLRDVYAPNNPMVYPRVRHGIGDLGQQLHLFTMLERFPKEHLQ